MAQISEISEHVQLKSSGHKLYEVLKNKMDFFFQMFPEVFKSFEIVEGNGLAHGSVIHLKYDFGLPGEVKERLAMDDANKSVTFEVLEGDILEGFEVFKVKIQVCENGRNGSSLNWSIEFVKANDDVAPPYNYLTFAAKMSKALDDYCLCNN